MELQKRILRRVELGAESFCWHWKGQRKNGYGRIRVGPKLRWAHRVAYEIFRDGAQIEGRQTEHLCGNRDCVNPWHLKPLDAAEVLVMELSKRLLSKVELIEETFCWRWKGAKLEGYGEINVGGRTCLAHRIAYEVFRDGKEIVGCHLHHECFNTWCINPYHLKPVTPLEHIGTHAVSGRESDNSPEAVKRRDARRLYRRRHPEKVKQWKLRYKLTHWEKYLEGGRRRWAQLKQKRLEASSTKVLSGDLI